MTERWRPVAGKVYRIGDRLVRLLYVRRGEPTFEIEVHPLPIQGHALPVEFRDGPRVAEHSDEQTTERA